MICKWNKCLKEFENEREHHLHLVEHINTSKKVQGEYHCVENCKFKGRLRCRVKTHLSTHFDFYDHKCLKCLVGFKRRDSLVKHLKRGCGPIDLIAINKRCNICDLNFAWRYQYRNHILKTKHNVKLIYIVDWLFFNK
jgi:hypothetical protein